MTATIADLELMFDWNRLADFDDDELIVFHPPNDVHNGMVERAKFVDGEFQIKRKVRPKGTAERIDIEVSF